MTANKVEKLEAAIAAIAAAALAAATGFAGFRLAYGFTDIFGSVSVGGISAMIGWIAGKSMMRVLAGAPRPFPQPVFDILRIEPVATETLEVLELTEADRFLPASAEEPLILDDVLAGVSDDSRVVRLFDRAAMPTPGQLRARIDRHLNGGTSHSPSPDASEALFEALADLRRSLR